MRVKRKEPELRSSTTPPSSALDDEAIGSGKSGI